VVNPHLTGYDHARAAHRPGRGGWRPDRHVSSQNRSDTAAQRIAHYFIRVTLPTKRQSVTGPHKLNQASATGAAASRSISAAVSGRSAGLGSAALVGVVVAALCSPFIFAVSSLSDEGVLLSGADRMLHGGRLYLDFFEFLPPGGFVITAAWFAVAGISLLSARILAILTITAIACFMYLACRLACKRASYPALVVIAWVIMTQGFWTQVSHHWFTTLFSMVAFWLALKSTDGQKPHLWEPLMAGLAAGAAAMVTPTRGALAMLAAAVSFADLRGRKSRAIAYLAGCAVMPTVLFAYIGTHHALMAAFDDIIVHPATRYASIQGVPFGYFANIQNLPLKYLFPVVALLTLLTCVRGWPACLDDRRFHVCVAFALAGFIGVFPRPDIVHIGFAAPLACPLLVYCARHLTEGALRKYRGAVALLAVAYCLPTSLAYLKISEASLRAESVRIARGRVSFLPNGEQGTKELVAFIANTPIEDSLFFYPYSPLLPFLTERQQISKYDIFIPEYTSPDQYFDACISVMQNASWIVVDRSATDPNAWLSVFPAMQNPRPTETRRFDQALESQFELVAQFGMFNVSRRIKAGNETACANING
jgi:hypothetical protein